MRQYYEKDRPGCCVVLEGGGVKCAYQYGALRSLARRFGSVSSAVACITGKKLEGFAGSSFGALNSAVFSAGGIDALGEMWGRISAESIFGDPGFAAITEGLFTGRLPRGIRRLIKAAALGAAPTRSVGELSRRYYDFVTRCVDESAARRSGLALGLTEVGLIDIEDPRTALKRERLRELWLEDMEEGSLADHVAASAAFPLLRPRRVEKRLFTDGGVLDNIPVHMAEKRGFSAALVIRAGVREPKKRWSDGFPAGFITPSRPLGTAACFTRDNVRALIALGEYDALKILNNDNGNSFFFQTEA